MRTETTTRLLAKDLEPARIGSLLFVFFDSPHDQIGSSSPIDTFATRLSAQALIDFYAGLPKGHPALKHRRYNKVDNNGVWRDDNMSWPGGNGPRYEVLHPKMGLPCKVPDGGWRFSTYKKFKLYEEHGFIQFR